MSARVKVKPQILTEDGEKKGVLLEYRDFENLMDELADLHGLHTVHKRTQKKTKAVPFDKIKKELLGDDIHK